MSLEWDNLSSGYPVSYQTQYAEQDPKHVFRASLFGACFKHISLQKTSSLHTFLSHLFEVKLYSLMLEINAVPKNANKTEMVNYSRVSYL